MGPLPYTWISQAIAAGRSAVIVGLVLWYLRGWKKRNKVRLTNTELKKWGVSRKIKYAGLEQLEAAGLIKVKKAAKRNPDVELLKTGCKL